jgi:hypothetical protein
LLDNEGASMTSENSEYVDRHDDEAPSMVTSLLTPGASAIAGFAFAVFSMLGQGTWSTALQSLFWSGGGFPQSSLGAVLSVWAVGTLLMAIVGIVLARRTLADAVTSASWEGNLARAALLVAAAGVLLSLLGIVGGLLHL